MIKSYENNERRLSDIVQHGSPEDIRRALLKIRAALLETTKWMQKNTARDQRNLTLHNFLTASIPYIDLANSHADGPVQVLAFCARNLYEIHLQSRYIQKGDANLKQWVAEAATDQIEILEGVLGLDPDNVSAQHGILKDEILRKEALLKKHNLEKKKPYPIGKVASDLGRAGEHSSLFKIFSKLLHPTSYLVNSSPEEVQNQEMRNMLVIHVQLYAWDIVGNIRQGIGFPET